MNSGVNMKKNIYKISAIIIAALFAVSCSKPAETPPASSETEEVSQVKEIWNIDPELYWSFSDLYDYSEIKGISGEIALDAQKGETLRLFDESQSEITDYSARIKDGQTLKKFDKDGNVVKETELKMPDVTVSDSTSSAAVTDDAPVSEKQTISILVPSGCNGIKSAAAEYEKKHADTDIKIIEKDFKQYASVVNYLSDLKEKNELPDLIMLDQKYLSSAYSAGLVTSLNEFESRDDFKQFTSTCIEGMMISDSVCALPIEATVSCFISNPDILSSCGLDMPKSYDELVDSCEKIKTYTDQVFPLGISSNDENFDDLSSLFLSYLWSTDRTFTDGSSAAFSSDDWNGFMEYINGLNSKGLISKDYSPSQMLYGKTAFGFAESSYYKNTFGTSAKYNFDCHSFAEVFGKNYISQMKLSGIAVVSNEDNEKEKSAYDFAKFFASNKEYTVQNCISRSTVPTLISAQSSEKFADGVWKTYISELDSSRCLSSDVSNDLYMRYVFDAVVASLEQDSDISAQAELLKSRINARLAR